MYSFPNFEPVSYSVSGSKCCFLTCIQVSQGAGKLVWYSHHFKNFLEYVVIHTMASLVAKLVKNLPTNAGDVSSIPGLGRYPGEGNGNPLQYSCLGHPMDIEVWQAIVCGSQKELDMT